MWQGEGGGVRVTQEVGGGGGGEGDAFRNTSVMVQGLLTTGGVGDIP